MASENKKNFVDQSAEHANAASVASAPGREWVTPAMNKLKAGSAELNVGTRDDGVDRS